MEGVLFIISLIAALAESAPLYGNDGGYMGFASYKPLKSQILKSLSRTGFDSDDAIDTSAGSPDISRQPSESEEDSSRYDVPKPVPKRIYRHRPSRPVDDSSEYTPKPLPKKYDVLDYNPGPQHGYGGNKISEDKPAAPYHRATLYGQSDGGYKISDAYQNQHIESHTDEDHDYKDDYISNPQPYEYGYALKDKYGNAQHRHETSDGHGSVKGSYGFTDEHGLYRSVQYVADKGGFRASIMTNEPGTENQDPADVKIKVEKGDH